MPRELPYRSSRRRARRLDHHAVKSRTLVIALVLALAEASLSEDWNLISRINLPVITQDGIGGLGNQTGLGDSVESVFFSPKAPTAGGWIRGVGPAFLLPTATDRALGAGKWGGGPTAIVLRQESGWTYPTADSRLRLLGVDERLMSVTW